MFFKNYNIIFNLKIYQRRIILLLFDSSLIIFSNWLTFCLINSSFENFLNIEIFYTSLLLCFIGLPIYLLSGQYKGLTRYVGSKYLYYLSIRNLFLCIINFFIQIFIFNQSFESLLSFSITFWFLLTSLSGFFRFGVRDILLNSNSDKEENIKRILIYGTGPESVQLFASLKLNQKSPNRNFLFLSMQSS